MAAPHGHPLVKFALLPRAAVTCDGCTAQLVAPASAFGCRACDYDLCEACRGPAETCPICCSECFDVRVLVHSSSASAASISSHKACATCRATLLARNQRCPFCRDEVVWSSVFNFLDGIKDSIDSAASPDELANLVGMWQEFELTRSRSDCLLFARDMIEDGRLATHLGSAIAMGSAAWVRFHSLINASEVDLHDAANGARMSAAVAMVMAAFERDGGGASYHGGALYAQSAIALLCAQLNGMSVAPMIPLCQRIGRACVAMWSDEVDRVRSTLPVSYVTAISDAVWGGVDTDPVHAAFFS